MVSFSGIVKSGISGAFVAAGYAATAHPVTLVALAALPWAAHRLSQCCSRRQGQEMRVLSVSIAAPLPAVAVVRQHVPDEFEAALEESRLQYEHLQTLIRALRYEENRVSREAGHPDKQPEQEFLQDLKVTLKYEEERLNQEMRDESGS